MKKYGLVSIFALSATTLTAGHAHADEAEGSYDGILVSASRAVSEPREVGSSVSVITREDIQRSQTTFVKNALQDVPGVIVSSDRPGAGTDISIRGSNNDEVLWLIDGIKLGDPSATSTQFQPDHLTARDIDRIEVLRGNQSSLYGSDAIGGVVNIITQRAAAEGFHVNAEAEAGSHGTLNGGASVLGKTGPLDFRVTATGYRHTGPSLADPRTAPADNPVTEKDEYWRYGFSGRAGLEVAEGLSFQTIGFWQDSASDLDNTGSDNANNVKKREYAYAGQGSYVTSDGNLKVDVTASRYVARRLYFGPYYSAEGDLYKGTRDNLSLDIAYGGTGPVSLAAGGNLEREKSKQTTGYSGDFGARINTRAAYGEIALRPIEGMTITGAARIDDNNRFGTFDTYRGTVAYILGNLKLRASYGTGAKAPGLYQLFDPTYGNADLKVETSKGGDIGFDFTVSDEVTLQASYFFNRKKNEINFDGGKPPSGGYSQFGRTRAQGVEAGLLVTPAPWLRISQTLTYVDHEVDDSANSDQPFTDSGQPKLSATTSVTVNPVEQASVTVRMRNRDGDSSSSYSPATSAYTVVDLLGSYQINDKVELYGRVVNLFDRWYQLSYGYQTLGLSAYGGVRVSF